MSAPSERMPAGVLLDTVTRHYRTAAGIVRALDGITAEIAPGSSVAIVGPSGCGKSTLLALIAGLALPTSGRVVVDGCEVSRLDERARACLRRERFGLVFQYGNLVPWLTAAENVAAQHALSGMGGCTAQHVTELLRDLGLADHAGKLPDQLSRGQRQRVAVARALVHRPSIVLADEPTGSLDSEAASMLTELMVAAQREAGTTLVAVTHDATVAARMDRTITLRDGCIDDAGGR